MLEKVLSFKHDSDNLQVAMGLPEGIDNKCREIVHFSTFTNYFIKSEFFDNEDDAPNNLLTQTGVLEKALSLCENDQEEVYTMFVFKDAHNHCKQALGAFTQFEEEKDEKERKKMQMLMELVELKAMVDDDNDRSEIVTPKDMFKKIRAAKDNMYNFENYYKVVTNESKN